MTQNYRKTLSLFSPEVEKRMILQTFYQTDLGQLYASLPIQQMASKIPAPAHEQKGLGRKPWFSAQAVSCSP